MKRRDLGAAALLVLAACAYDRTTVSVGDGVTLVAPHGAVVDSDLPHRLAYVTGSWRVEVVDGALSLNGVPYGQVQAGDRIVLSESGELSVNGHDREPSGDR